MDGIVEVFSLEELKTTSTWPEGSIKWPLLGSLLPISKLLDSAANNNSGIMEQSVANGNTRVVAHSQTSLVQGKRHNTLPSTVKALISNDAPDYLVCETA